MSENQSKITEPQVSAQDPGRELSPVHTLFGKSWSIFRPNFGKFVLLLLIPILGLIPLFLCITILAILGAAGGGDSNLFFMFGRYLSIVGIVAGVIVAVAVSVISQAATYVLIKDSGRDPSIKEVFLSGKSIAWRFFLVNLAAFLMVFLWSLLFLIPGLIMAVFYSMSQWVLVYENTGGFRALKRSKQLIRGHWWPVLGRFVLIYLLLIAISTLPVILIDNAAFKAVWSLVSNLISFLAAPFILVYICFIYHDLRRIGK